MPAGQHVVQCQTHLLQLRALSNGAICLGHQVVQAGQDGLRAGVEERAYPLKGSQGAHLRIWACASERRVRSIARVSG